MSAWHFWNVEIDFHETYENAVKEVLTEQAELGIDVVTDGELNRENYVWFLW